MYQTSLRIAVRVCNKVVTDLLIRYTNSSFHSIQFSTWPTFILLPIMVSIQGGSLYQIQISLSTSNLAILITTLLHLCRLSSQSQCQFVNRGYKIQPLANSSCISTASFFHRDSRRENLFICPLLLHCKGWKLKRFESPTPTSPPPVVLFPLLISLHSKYKCCQSSLSQKTMEANWRRSIFRISCNGTPSSETWLTKNKHA